MFRDFSRAQQRFLGLVGPLRSRPDAESEAPSTVIFTPEAEKVLLQQSYATGSLRGGPLFGSVLEGEITVVAAVPNGYACLEPMLRHDPLRCDERYVLGWSDALAYRYGGQVDWVGQWVMRPDGQLGPVEDHLVYLRRGVQSDMFNSAQFLACVGWDDGDLHSRLYTYDPQRATVGTLKTSL